MAEVSETITTSPAELLGTGRRHLAVRDYSSAAGVLAHACELLAKEHGDTADPCAEAYLWYGKALLGLSREESGVLGDGMPGTTKDEEDDDNDDQEDNMDNENKEAAKSENEEEENEAEDVTGKDCELDEGKTEEREAEGQLEVEPQPGVSNGDANDESATDLGDEDDVDNLQLAWETLDLARSIFAKRVESGAGDAARSLLADVHLTLGEVALESETYDKAVIDMQSCLEIQKELYQSDDRRIAETHYQIGLANSLASNFEDAILHFKNAVNILETRIRTLENPALVNEDETVKKYRDSDPFYTVEGEIKELKELLPEIRDKIQDMMDYKAETIKRVRETLCSANGQGSSSTNGASGSKETKQVSNISHLIKRKRKSSEGGEGGDSAPKRMNS